MKIYVAGHGGLVGSALVRRIEADGIHTWVGKTRAELDLLDRKATFEYLVQEKPDAVIIAAAKVGGIGANNNYPVDFLSQNLQIETNLIDGSHAADIQKLIFLGSSCIYPIHSKQPIKEDSLLTGPLEKTNEGYAIAKIAGLKLVQFYRSQYGRYWVTAMPTNLYGPYDNFDLETSHVIPALIHKLHKAKMDSRKNVTLWGDGTPKREFLHVDDFAFACLTILDTFPSDSFVNVGFGSDISILNLAKMIADVVGYRGDIYWDQANPNGVDSKLLDSTKIFSMGWHPKIDLPSGLISTYNWFLNSSGSSKIYE